MDKQCGNEVPLLERNGSSDGDRPFPFVEDEESDSSCCCCCCCCCCCGSSHVSSDLSSAQWIKRFRKWITKDEPAMSAFDIILGLFAGNSESINKLIKWRINPDERSNTRNDLEYFIPQLCGYLIDESKSQDLRDQLFSALTQASNASFYFSHRLYFFLQAYTSDTGLSEHVLSVMKQLVKEITDQSLYNEDEVLYVSKPKKLIKCLKDLDLDVLYDPILNPGSESKLERAGKKQSERITRAQNLRMAYIHDGDSSYDPLLEDIHGGKINARDLVIYPFLANFTSHSCQPSKQSISAASEIIPEDFDENMRKSAYMSTPFFIKRLTDISRLIIARENKLEVLKEELRQLNQKLPATVYIPFVNRNIRNNIVLHIIPKEARVFVTKTKAPYLICIELYDPFEVVHEPLVLEPSCASERLPAPPALPRTLTKMKTLKRLMPTQDILVLGTVPRNLVDSRLLMAKDRRSASGDDEVITIEKFKKVHSVRVGFKRVAPSVHKEDGKSDVVVCPSNKRSSLLCPDIDSLTESMIFPKRPKGSRMVPATPMNRPGEFCTFESSERVKQFDVNLTPVLVEQHDVVIVRDEEKEARKESHASPHALPHASPHVSPHVSPPSLKDIFGESFAKKCERIREASPFGNLSTWKLIQVIVKQGCDLRQEQFAIQLISQFDQIFRSCKVPIWLKPYEIICTGPNSGLMQCVDDAVSLDSLNQKLKKLGIDDLSRFFGTYYPKDSGMFIPLHCVVVDRAQAKYNFAASLAGYSLVCYVLQIKDRHNGNIMIDRDGHLIHIDFDYFISNSPGGNFKFERAPFKLTKEFISVLEGEKSQYFGLFRKLMVRGFMALQKEHKKIVVLVETMLCVNGNLPCFFEKERTISGLYCRLFPRRAGKPRDCVPLSEMEAVAFIDQLISEASDSFRTKVYDLYQYYLQGIN